jgi:hypothetical protein
MQTTIDQVRQVLMNEMGLTRESIKELAEKIVLETVDKHMESLEKSGKLTTIMREAFDAQYRGKDGHYDTFGRLMRDEAAKSAREFVKEHIKIHTS